ncbi:hypothetical protein PRIC1_007708 [Phytophthora ramorum]
MEAQGRKGTALFLGQNQKKKGLIIQVEAWRDKTRQCVVQLAQGDSDPASIFTLTSPALECVCRYLHLQTGTRVKKASLHFTVESLGATNFKQASNRFKAELKPRDFCC